ncbi:MAG: ribonuclease Y [Actinomycetota bacterium]
MIIVAVILGILIPVAAALGFRYARQTAARDAGSVEAKARTVLADAERDAETSRRESVVEAKDEILKLRGEFEEELKTRRSELERKEVRIDERERHVEGKDRDIERQAREIAEKEQSIVKQRESVEGQVEEIRRQLEKVASMTAAEAKQVLMKRIEDEAKRDAMSMVRELETRAREEAEQRARRIITLAIQRLASEQTAESTVATINLPSDDMKGRIIGREGRNIRAFEATTGVNIIIDDTPEAVLLSCFDPVRREIGRLTLEKLIADGRIHPARIEEMHERAKGEVEQEIRKAGEEAVLDVGMTDVHPEMIRILGRLQYRTSYGQNVLKHLVESAHIAGSMAAELGLGPDQVKLVKRCALMHDIGKAVTHEVEGSHAIIGAELARRLKEPPEVVHAIESHHGEVEQRTLEAVLSQTADQISGGRPGARRETLETYVKRLEKLEEIATSYPGVEKVFAMQAGREVRVMVKPEELDDLTCQVLARDIAKRIEEELQYPGQIRITVVREIRATEYAK